MLLMVKVGVGGLVWGLRFGAWGLGLVLLGDLFGGDEGIAGEVGAVKVNAVEVNGGDLVVVVASVVVNAGVEVAAGGGGCSRRNRW